MSRSEREVRAAIDQLGEVWKYNNQSPASHRTIEEGARIALEDALNGDVDTDLLYAALDDEDTDFNSFENLFNFGYVDAVLWYLEKKTLAERMDNDNGAVLRDPMNVD